MASLCAFRSGNLQGLLAAAVARMDSAPVLPVHAMIALDMWHRYSTHPQTDDVAPGHALVYDGSCGLCRRAVAFLQRRRLRCPIQFIDYHDERCMSEVPQISVDEASQTVIL